MSGRNTQPDRPGSDSKRKPLSRSRTPRGREAEDIVHAIRNGDVDAVVVQSPGQEGVRTLTDLDTASELNEMVRAIRHGEVDAFVVSEGGDERVYTWARLEHALRESEAAQRAALEHLHLTLAASGAVAWEWHLAKQELRWSSECRDLYGFAPSEPLTFESWLTRVHPADAAPLLARVESISNFRAELWRDEFRIIHPQKGVRWIAATGKIARCDDGQPVSIRGIHIDVTDRKQIENDLDQHRRNLEEQVRTRTFELTAAHERLRVTERMAAVGTFAAGLAHDMNNILLPLGMQLELLEGNRSLDQDAREGLSAVAGLLGHLRQMSKNLSLFSRDPDQEGTEGSTDLSAWCKQVWSMIESSISGRSVAAPIRIALKCDVPADLPAIHVAPHRLTQAVLNLVHNARDGIFEAHNRLGPRNLWTPGRGVIHLEAFVTEDRRAVAIQVSDDGIGMDELTRSRCVELFFTTKDRPTSAGSVGSGMGLSIAYALAQRAGGRMDIQSEVEKGTVVTLTFPITQTHG